MKNFNKQLIRLMIGLLFLLSMSSFAAGVGSDANPSSIASTFTAFYSPTPQVLATRTPYGGRVCTLTSSTNGFTTALAKWRTPNIVGTISYDGYTYEIQRTNIPGIGAIARLEASFNSTLNTPTVVIGSEYKTITSSTNSGSDKVDFGRKFWALVSIPGETFIPGTYSLGQSETMVDVWCKAGNSANDTHGGGYLSGNVVINSPTCSFGSDVSAVMTLDLGEYQWADLRNMNVGSNFGSVSKSINMTCQTGSWPKVTISDKNNNNTSNIISLSNPTDVTTAKGVGVQVFLNNSSVAQKLVTQVNLVPAKLTKEATIELPIQFKYVKTSDTTSAGKANAIVDFTFTYD